MKFERTKKRSIVRRGERTTFVWQVVLGLLGLSALALILTGLYHVSRLESLTIRDIEIRGGITIQADSLRTEVAMELRGAYWRLIPHSFSLFYPHDRIIRTLELHPRIHSISVERMGFTGLSITFEEYVPHALLCPATLDNPCYFINEEGYAFEEVPHMSGGALVRYIDGTKERIARGDTLGHERLRTAETFIANVERDLSLRIGVVRYTADADIEFEINGGGALKVDDSKNLDTAFEHIRVVLETPEYAHIGPGNFQYIDARFPPKIFVNDTMEPVATSTSETATATDAGV